MSAKATGAQPNGDASSTHNRQHHDGSSGRAFTVEQKAAVIRIRRCKPTAFYDILGLEEVRTTCTDGEIKKAYRKLSLLTHPDKNGYDGADEAFKMVSRAFQILSDADKKAKFDRFGGDPDNRFSGASASDSSSFSNFAQQGGYGARGPMFEADLSPEDLFRQFFSGGMGGPFGGPLGGMGGLGGFGGPGGFVFNMGGPGIRVHQFGGNGPRRRPHNHTEQTEPRSAWEIFRSLLPVLLLFVIPLLSNLFTSSGPNLPSIVLEGAQPPYTMGRVSESLKVPYWVAPSDVQGWEKRKWRQLDDVAESYYINRLGHGCELEKEQRQRMVYDAQGWFLPDQQKLRKAREMPMPKCDEYRMLTGRMYF